MKLSRKQGCLLWLIGVPLVAWALYKLIYPTYLWHEKIAVTVTTPDGEKSGSAVRSTKVVRTPKLLPQIGGAEISVKGEAVVVDLGEDRFLFSLLGAPLGWTPSVYYAQNPDRPRNKRDIHRWESSLRGKGPLPIPHDKLPMLVTFGDINDPASVKRVDPDDLDGAFGLCPDGSGLRVEDAPWRAQKMTYRAWSRYKASGVSSLAEYRAKHFNRMQEEAMEAAIVPRDTSTDCHRLKSITLEITNEPVNEGKVEEVLGWIYSGGWIVPFELRKDPKYNDVERNMSPSDFIDGRTWHSEYKKRKNK